MLHGPFECQQLLPESVPSKTVTVLATTTNSATIMFELNEELYPRYATTIMAGGLGNKIINKYPYMPMGVRYVGKVAWERPEVNFGTLVDGECPVTRHKHLVMLRASNELCFPQDGLLFSEGLPDTEH